MSIKRSRIPLHTKKTQYWPAISLVNRWEPIVWLLDEETAWECQGPFNSEKEARAAIKIIRKNNNLLREIDRRHVRGIVVTDSKGRGWLKKRGKRTRNPMRREISEREFFKDPHNIEKKRDLALERWRSGELKPQYYKFFMSYDYDWIRFPNTYRAYIKPVYMKVFDRCPRVISRDFSSYTKKDLEKLARELGVIPGQEGQGAIKAAQTLGIFNLGSLVRLKRKSSDKVNRYFFLKIDWNMYYKAMVEIERAAKEITEYIYPQDMEEWGEWSFDWQENWKEVRNNHFTPGQALPAIFPEDQFPEELLYGLENIAARSSFLPHIWTSDKIDFEIYQENRGEADIDLVVSEDISGASLIESSKRIRITPRNVYKQLLEKILPEIKSEFDHWFLTEKANYKSSFFYHDYSPFIAQECPGVPKSFHKRFNQIT